MKKVGKNNKESSTTFSVSKRNANDTRPISSDTQILVPADGKVIGKISERGGFVSVDKDGRIISAARNSRWTTTDSVTEGMIEYWLGAPGSWKKSRETIESLYKALKSSKTGEENLANVLKAFYLGPETEGVYINRSGNGVEKISSKELTLGQEETAHDPQINVLEMVHTIANWVKDNRRVLVAGAVPVDKASNMEPNIADKKIGDYIKFMQGKLIKTLGGLKDEEAEKVWNLIAKKEGYRDYKHLFKSVGNLAPWFLNASHISLGLPHFEQNGRQWVPEDLMIGISDLVASNLGTVLEWMTFSGPNMFGVTLEQKNGSPLLDARSHARHILGTTGQDVSPIKNSGELHRRLVKNNNAGISNTLDRNGYVSRSSGQASMHGSVRIRGAISIDEVSTAQSGRVEAVGPGAGDILSRAESAAYLKVIGAIAAEAAFFQMSAVDYVAGKNGLGLISANLFNKRQANIDFNNGNMSRLVKNILSDATKLCYYVEGNFPAVAGDARLARIGLFRLQSKQQPTNLEDHKKNLFFGSFAHAVVGEIVNNGLSPEELTAKLLIFQQWQASYLSKGNNGYNVIKNLYYPQKKRR